MKRCTDPALTGRGTLQAERVRSADLSVSYRFGARDLWPTVEFRRFTESSEGQIATLFGVPGSDPRGQYFVGQVGDVAMAGWGGAFPLTNGTLANVARVRAEARVLTFKLGARASLPAMQTARKALDPPA